MELTKGKKNVWSFHSPPQPNPQTPSPPPFRKSQDAHRIKSRLEEPSQILLVLLESDRLSHRFRIAGRANGRLQTLDHEEFPHVVVEVPTFGRRIKFQDKVVFDREFDDDEMRKVFFG